MTIHNSESLPPSQRRSLEIARELGALLVSSFDEPFEALEPRFKALERRLLAASRSQRERREIRRRIAEELYNEACGRDCPWPVVGRALRRLQRLGYTDVERRYHIAAQYALWCQRHPEHEPRGARHLLDEAERRLLRLPRGHRYRTELLSQLAELRLRAGPRFERISPCSPARR